MNDGNIADKEVQQPNRSPASPATPDKQHLLGEVSRPTGSRRVYLFLFNKDPYSCSTMFLDWFVHQKGGLKTHKVLSGNIPMDWWPLYPTRVAAVVLLQVTP